MPKSLASRMVSEPPQMRRRSLQDQTSGIPSIGLAVCVLDLVCELPNCPCFWRLTCHRDLSRSGRGYCGGQVLRREVHIFRYDRNGHSDLNHWPCVAASWVGCRWKVASFANGLLTDLYAVSNYQYPGARRRCGGKRCQGWSGLDRSGEVSSRNERRII